MCGIAGILASEGERPQREVIARMTRALAHRGPDAEGIVVEDRIALGHRRLSIIDLRAVANQPMRDASGRYLLVFNGEIYNFKALRTQLEGLGCAFSTQSDSEVLLTALIRWGAQALPRLVGMFAFAFWDETRRRLLLARDRLGKKPLFFARLPREGIAFASEPAALALHPRVAGTIDRAALARFLRLNYVACNRSLYAGIESLPPACYAEIEAGGKLHIAQYWDLAEQFRDKASYRSEDEAAEALTALIDEAVRDRLVSDVPLGAFLSGGVDSSTIVASMRNQRHAGSIYTFSSGFLEDSYDESPLAEQLAADLGIVHRTQTLDTRRLDLMPAVMAAAVEPLADTSALPMFFLSQFTRQNVTVALSGDGGDECFAGYETYVADKLHKRLCSLPLALRRRLPVWLDRWLPVDHGKVAWPEKLRRFSAALPLDGNRAHAAWRDIFSDDELREILRPAWPELRAADDADDLYDAYFAQHFAAVADCDPLDQACYVDIKTWLADDVLVKADRASMAHGLEVRCPLLDHRIVEFAARLPAHLKLHGYRKKHVLKLSQRKRLPRAVLERPKQGFNAPVSHWINGSLRQLCEDTLLSSPMAEWCDRKALERLLRDHQARVRDNGLKLFGLLTLGLFLSKTLASLSPGHAAHPTFTDPVDARD